jgi:hypothetical protein
MRYRLILPIAALLAALVAVPAAQAKVRVGLSEQNPAMFHQANWKNLKLKRVRYIVSWDYAKSNVEHAEVTGFMDQARTAKQEVLVEFNAHRGCFINNKYKKIKACKAPSAKAYKTAVKGFRAEFPYAKTFAAWNEVNHVSQPTFRKPKLAATYYKAMKSVCKGCTVMAADVLDSSDVASYLRKFQRATKGKGRIWGLHNYKDVNRHQSKGIRTKATKYMFQLAKTFKRVKRIYVYRWFGEKRSARFDAGLVGPNGGSRPGLKQFKKSIKGLPR